MPASAIRARTSLQPSGPWLLLFAATARPRTNSEPRAALQLFVRARRSAALYRLDIRPVTKMGPVDRGTAQSPRGDQAGTGYADGSPGMQENREVQDSAQSSPCPSPLGPRSPRRSSPLTPSLHALYPSRQEELSLESHVKIDVFLDTQRA